MPKNTVIAFAVLFLINISCSDDKDKNGKEDVGIKQNDSSAAATDGTLNKHDGPINGNDGGGSGIDALTCPNGSKPDWQANPNCKTFIEKILKECCPNADETFIQSLAGIVCYEGADALCKESIDSVDAFNQKCDGMKLNPACI